MHLSCQSLHGIPTYRLNSLGKADEHPPALLYGAWHILALP